MKYLITVCLVGAMLVGSVYADDTQTVIQQGSVEGHQTTIVKGPSYSEASAQGGDAAAGSYSGIYWDYTTNSYVRYPEYRLSAVNPGQAPLPWPFPSQYFLWNTFRDQLSLRLYHKHKWTIKEVEEALKRIKPKNPKIVGGVVSLFSSILPHGPEDVARELKLKGFDWQISLNDYNLRSDESPEFETIVDANYAEIFKGYTWMGMMGATGSEKLLVDQVIRCAVRVALIYDLDLGLITPGINPVNNSTGGSSGAAYTTAGVTNNFSIIGSVSGGKAYVEGRPGVGVIFFRKNGVPDGISDKLRSIKEEEEIPGVPVSPEMKEMFRKAEVNGGLQSRFEKSDKTSQIVSVEERIWENVCRRAAGN